VLWLLRGGFWHQINTRVDKVVVQEISTLLVLKDFGMALLVLIH
jgi:hypothetical protein